MTKDEFLRSLWSEEDRALVTFDFHGALPISIARRLETRKDIVFGRRFISQFSLHLDVVEMTEWGEKRLEYLQVCDLLETYQGPDYISDPVEDFGFQRLVFSSGRIDELINEGQRDDLYRMANYPSRPFADFAKAAS